jgi:transcriptional regulator with XRE-family HTH domain
MRVFRRRGLSKHVARVTALAKRFGQALVDARNLRAWSQEELAEHANLSRGMIGAIERGQRVPSFPVAVALAELLDISLDDAALARAGRPNRDWPAEAAALLRAVPPDRRREAIAILRVIAAAPGKARGR